VNAKRTVGVHAPADAAARDKSCAPVVALCGADQAGCDAMAANSSSVCEAECAQHRVDHTAVPASTHVPERTSSAAVLHSPVHMNGNIAGAPAGIPLLHSGSTPLFLLVSSLRI
jgi:hypothetical protein